MTEPDPRTLVLPAGARDAIDRWARQAFPLEACGLLIGRATADTDDVHRATYCDNVLQSPTHFEIAPESWFAAWRAAAERGLEILGVWHSHPAGTAKPSRLDARHAWPEHVWLIASLDDRGVTERRAWRLSGGAMREQRLADAHAAVPTTGAIP